MTPEVNAPTIDHRHPELVSISMKIVGTAEHAAEASGVSLSDAVNAATCALLSNDSGEHREIAVAAIANLTQQAELDLLAIYDATAADDAPKTLKKLPEFLLAPCFDLDALIQSVIRFEACHHVNLIRKFVSRFVSRQDPSTLNRTPDELFAYGYVGLSNALRSYDPTTNTISTFANFRIIGAVRDGIRSESPVPKRLTTFVRAVESAEETLTKALSRVPTQEEVEEVLGDQARYMHLYPRLRRQASLDNMVGYNPVSPLDVEEQVAMEQAGEDIRCELSDLDETERIAVQLLYADGLTARKASIESGIPQAQLTRAAKSGLAKLRCSPKLQRWQGLVAA